MVLAVLCWLSCLDGFGMLTFLSKCVDAGWLLEVGFHVIFMLVNLDVQIVILGVQNLAFGRLGASTLPSWEPILAPWGQPWGHGSSEDAWVRNRIAGDIEPHFESCLESGGSDLLFVASQIFAGHSLDRFLNRIGTPGAFQARFSCGKYIEKQRVTELVVL